ncbi:hypothetical protein [Alphaproteobacteria bacterium endosymbiont of Tiliacea citrago]|uniref:hypothetical protein n=1 Tax=Alphaproteobacteria bacterium endosymbiont of Tiliacea citrago TaxID=3077944 RepID=UPI00313C2584
MLLSVFLNAPKFEKGISVFQKLCSEPPLKDPCLEVYNSKALPLEDEIFFQKECLQNLSFNEMLLIRCKFKRNFLNKLDKVEDIQEKLSLMEQTEEALQRGYENAVEVAKNHFDNCLKKLEDDQLRRALSIFMTSYQQYKPEPFLNITKTPEEELRDRIFEIFLIFNLHYFLINGKKINLFANVWNSSSPEEKKTKYLEIEKDFQQIIRVISILERKKIDSEKKSVLKKTEQKDDFLMRYLKDLNDHKTKIHSFLSFLENLESNLFSKLFSKKTEYMQSMQVFQCSYASF